MTLRCVCALLALSLTSAAQQPPPAPQPGAGWDMAALGEYVKKQFGPNCKAKPTTPRSMTALKAAPKPIVLLTADFDGDGAEDVAIVGLCPKPLAAAPQFGYKVADPYDAFFGYGDPGITQHFNAQDPDNDRVLMIVHGWRLPQPKAKLVIINLPFDSVTTQEIVLKKRKAPRSVIVATESGLMESTIYWDGKKYRYEPGTGGIDE